MRPWATPAEAAQYTGSGWFSGEALHSFTDAEEDEIAIEAGEPLYIRCDEPCPEGWRHASRMDGSVGLVVSPPARHTPARTRSRAPHPGPSASLTLTPRPSPLVPRPSPLASLPSRHAWRQPGTYVKLHDILIEAPVAFEGWDGVGSAGRSASRRATSCSCAWACSRAAGGSRAVRRAGRATWSSEAAAEAGRAASCRVTCSARGGARRTRRMLDAALWQCHPGSATAHRPAPALPGAGSAGPWLRHARVGLGHAGWGHTRDHKRGCAAVMRPGFSRPTPRHLPRQAAGMVSFMWGRYGAQRRARMMAELRVAALLQAKLNLQEGHASLRPTLRLRLALRPTLRLSLSLSLSLTLVLTHVLTLVLTRVLAGGPHLQPHAPGRPEVARPQVRPWQRHLAPRGLPSCDARRPADAAPTELGLHSHSAAACGGWASRLSGTLLPAPPPPPLHPALPSIPSAISIYPPHHSPLPVASLPAPVGPQCDRTAAPDLACPRT